MTTNSSTTAPAPQQSTRLLVKSSKSTISKQRFTTLSQKWRNDSYQSPRVTCSRTQLPTQPFLIHHTDPFSDSTTWVCFLFSSSCEFWIEDWWVLQISMWQWREWLFCILWCYMFQSRSIGMSWENHFIWLCLLISSTWRRMNLYERKGSHQWWFSVLCGY